MTLEQHQFLNKKVKAEIEEIVAICARCDWCNVDKSLAREYFNEAKKNIVLQRRDIRIFLDEKYTQNKAYFEVCRAFKSNYIRLKKLYSFYMK